MHLQTDVVKHQGLIRLAAIAESRDPSGIGHQHHVGEIAEAIAVEFGLDGIGVEGIRIAAQIHDIGKVMVPASVLVKTDGLDLADWELIKTHCQAGFEILDGIAFGLPVAEMVLQHHERLDGSGYPAGLRGDEITLGARIIAVADTVEDALSWSDGMVTGLGAAMDTVRRGSGRHFDRHVVTACLRLFRDGRLPVGQDSTVRPIVSGHPSPYPHVERSGALSGSATTVSPSPGTA